MPDHVMTCSSATGGTAADTTLNQVLLVHGTGPKADESGAGNYAQAPPQVGYNNCTVSLPDCLFSNIPLNSEYVVAATQRMNRDFAGKADLLTYSPGDLDAHWAMKCVPEIGGLVDDFVSCHSCALMSCNQAA